MFKLKSNLLIFTIVFLVGVFFTNCSDSTSNDDDDIAGTWLLTKVTFDLPVGSYVEYPEEEGYSLKLTIRSDNTYTAVQTEGDYADTTSGTWSTSGNNLTIMEEGEEINAEYNLDGDKLEITLEQEIQEIMVPVIQEFTRQ